MIEIKKDVSSLFFRNKFIKDKKDIIDDKNNIKKYDKQRIKSLLNEEINKGLEIYYNNENI